MADAKVAQSVRGGVTSERKLVEELRMHLAWRWFTGLALASWTQKGFWHRTPHESPAVRYRDHAFRRPNRAKLTKQLAKIQAQKHLKPNEADQCAQNQFSERGFYDSEFKSADVKR